MALEAVLFDLDGVLIDSREAWYALLCAALRAFGCSAIDRETFDAFFGQGVVSAAERFFGGMEPEVLDAWLRSHFMDHVEHVHVNADAAAVLNALASRGIARAVVTNTSAPLARELVRGAGLEPDVLVGAGDAAEKPAPDLLQLACEKLAVRPGACWMVGDSRFDREAAVAAGIPFVGYGIDGARRIARLSELIHLPAVTG